ncbi:alpha/beta hydrolase [Cellulomonas fimi]|uniref:alpha/beta fold hydrolase n=1 Tax=Cellulomonas fimi TaxID=1708 RepID=UPI00234C67A5|nr:alpha/beta hydrolase [Cellulomonas fimi]MDC7120218.1 alpha/beta hydrolase [Cellulomonas fimi]
MTSSAARTAAAPDWAVEEHGTGRGTTTHVLVHGIGASARYFRPLARSLARPPAGAPGSGGLVLVPDLPGFGRSPRADHAPTIAKLADGLVEQLAARGVDRAVLVGHSMGAQVVTEVARRHPAVAERVVLLGPVVESDARSAVAQAVRLVRDTPHEPLRANAIVFSDYARAGVRWYARQLPHMLGFPTETAVAAVRCPVLVVRGEQDRVASDGWVERLARIAPDGRAVVVPGAAHVVQYSHPDVVAELCRGGSPAGVRWVGP